MDYICDRRHGKPGTARMLVTGYPMSILRISVRLTTLLIIAIVLVGQPVQAAPGDILFSDDFESGFANWTAAGAGDASIGTETANSGTSSMRTRWNTVTATSIAFNASVPAADFSVWVRRGANSFSNRPEGGENLMIQYLNSSNNWITLDTFLGGNPQGQIFTRTYNLNADALHANLQIRFMQTGGNGPDFDYWHIDDVVVVEATLPATPVGSCDDFESGLGNWAVVSSGGDAGTGGQTFNSASSSLYTRWGAVSVTTNVDYSSSSTASITVWVQRGDDSFSENPDAGEDLVVEYFNNSGSWINLETFPGGGTQGEVFNRSYSLGADALHSGFQLRIRQTGGSGNDNDYWHIDDVCFLETTVSPSAVAWYSMQQDVWTNAAGEVIDDSGNNLHGQTFNSPVTDNTNPAIAGDPGTCRYGVFDGTNQYIEVNDDPLLDISSTLTVATWINPDVLPGGGLMTIVSKDENFEFHVTPTGQINWWWNNSGGTARQITTTGTAIDPNDASAPNNGWYHVAIVYSQTAATQTIYIDGVARATATYNEALINNNDPLQIASDQGFAGRYFDGLIDEVYVYNQALSAAQIVALRDKTRPCGGLLAYYAMEESSWPGAGSVIDSSGLDNHGDPVGTVSPNSPNGLCARGFFPDNASANIIDAVDSTLTPGDTGSITLWYNPNTDFNGGGDTMLIDASADLGNNNADKFFMVTRRNNGHIRFRVEDSADTDSEADTASFSYTAGTWIHLAVTWDIPNSTLQIFVDGTLAATSTTALNGIAGNWNTLYIGDNRTNGVNGGGYTGNAANGFIDEVRIYSDVLSAADINMDRTGYPPCADSTADHYAIVHDGTAVTCQAEPITIEAHLSDHSIDTGYTGTLALSTSTNHGDWTISSGNGTLINGTADDGAASYDMVALDNGSAILNLKNTNIETLNINVTDSVISETSGTAIASEDPDLVFAETGFVFLADTVASNINNQIAGKPSNLAPNSQVLELQAIRTSDSTGQCEAALQGNVNIELAFECRNPTTCSASQVNIDGGTPTNIAGNALAAVGTYTPVALDFGNATDTTATFIMDYPDVGEIQLYARYNMPLDDGSATPSGNYMLGNSNAFVVRPFAFYVDVSGNPGAADQNGAVFTRAGAGFTVNSTAVIWDAADDVDNDGIADGHEAADIDETNNTDLSDNLVALNYGQETVTENIVLSSLLDQPSPGNDTGLGGTTTISSFTNGTGNSTVTHDEVGIIEITANHADGDYLGVSGAIGKSGYVGRFIPDHFTLSSGMISNRVTLSCVPASLFTYMEEDQRLELTLTAENTGNTTTQNYTGVFAMLNLGNPANFNVGAIDTAVPTPLTSRITTNSSSGTWSNGVANPVFLTVSLNRAATTDGPYANLNWGIAPIDPDGVQMGAYNLDVNNDTTNDRTLVVSNEVRFGRAFVESTSGSELLPLVLPVHVEFYDGTQFIRNTGDNCSTYNSTDLTFSNRVVLPADPAAAGSGTFINGTFDPANPMQLNSGGNSGSVDATLNVPAYLEFDWDGDGNFDNDPAGKATFGIFDINSRQIYTREVY